MMVKFCNYTLKMLVIHYYFTYFAIKILENMCGNVLRARDDIQISFLFEQQSKNPKMCTGMKQTKVRKAGIMNLVFLIEKRLQQIKIDHNTSADQFYC